MGKNAMIFYESIYLVQCRMRIIIVKVWFLVINPCFVYKYVYIINAFIGRDTTGFM